MDLKELYREVILDHNRSPRNFGRLEPADATAAGRNPLCGDVLDITLRMQDDRVSGCALRGSGLRDFHGLGLAHEPRRSRAAAATKSNSCTRRCMPC